MQETTQMGIFRLYSGDDGESHIEKLELASQPDLTALHGAKGVVFRSVAPGYFSDWHTAPRRQYVITLSGEAEIGLGDGTIHRLGPGDVNLAEDLTGHGHTTRVVGVVPRVTATIHLE
jgi:quercetin dioxygenase-like cupin family protein